MKTFNFDEALIALQSDLLGFAYKLTADKHDAEDLLQETMLKACLLYTSPSPRDTR